MTSRLRPCGAGTVIIHACTNRLGHRSAHNGNHSGDIAREGFARTGCDGKRSTPRALMLDVWQGMKDFTGYFSLYRWVAAIVHVG